MKISELIYELQTVGMEHGDIEVTCTGTVLKEAKHGDVFETTVENLEVSFSQTFGKKVRLML